MLIILFVTTDTAVQQTRNKAYRLRDNLATNCFPVSIFVDRPLTWQQVKTFPFQIWPYFGKRREYRVLLLFCLSSKDIQKPFFTLIIRSFQLFLRNVVSAPGRAGDVKSIRILHSASSENSCHPYEILRLFIFFVVSFRNPYKLCKAQNWNTQSLNRGRAGVKKEVACSSHQCKGHTFQTIYWCNDAVLFLKSFIRLLISFKLPFSLTEL